MAQRDRSYVGEYNGAALQAFVRGVRLKILVDKILRAHGLDSIDPKRWYDLELARSLYASVGREVGTRSLTRIGAELINAGVFPPTIQDVHSALAAVVPGYRLNCRGSNIGELSYAHG